MKALLLGCVLNVFVHSDLVAQQIKCLDTISVNGYFVQRKCGKNFDPESSDIPVFYVPRFITNAEVRAVTIDTLFARITRNGGDADTVKYLAYTPKLPSYVYKKYGISAQCFAMLNEGINIAEEVKPENFYYVRTSKFCKKSVIGFCYVRVKWLHLKIIDAVAFDYFNEPYTLPTPYVKPHFYDIYIPLKLCYKSKKVSMDKSRKLTY